MGEGRDLRVGRDAAVGGTGAPMRAGTRTFLSRKPFLKVRRPRGAAHSSSSGQPSAPRGAESDEHDELD